MMTGIQLTRSPESSHYSFSLALFVSAQEIAGSIHHLLTQAESQRIGLAIHAIHAQWFVLPFAVTRTSHQYCL